MAHCDIERRVIDIIKWDCVLVCVFKGLSPLKAISFLIGIGLWDVGTSLVIIVVAIHISTWSHLNNLKVL